MITDSLYYDIPNKEFADSLFRAVNVVSQHTDNLSGFSGCVTWSSFIASIITILGIILIGFEISSRRTSVRCQKQIILDLIRHFFINNAISEVVRLKLSSKTDSATLKEGIMQRYCVLDSDIDLGLISYSSKSYELLHSLRVNLRNYNISATCAEKHFTDPNYPKDKKLADLDDILTRSIKLTEGFISFAKKRRMGLGEKDIKKYIIDYYMNAERIPKWKNKGMIDYSIKIQSREAGDKRAFYDDQPYELKNLYDLLIRARYSYVVISNIKHESYSKKTKLSKQ